MKPIPFLLRSLVKDKKIFISEFWPIIISVSILLGISIIIFLNSVKANNGYFNYILDDAYIHLAIAKKFVKFGVWGINNNEFSSSTSSILWTFILSSIFLIFHNYEIVPLLINIILGTLILSVVFSILKKYTVPEPLIFITLLAVIFFTPLPALIYTGMEHLLHILLTIIFIYHLIKIFQNENGTKNRDLSLLLILSGLLPLARYEGLFLTSLSGFLLIINKKKTLGMFVLLTSIFPITVYGILSISEGWLFLPNSIYLKSVNSNFNSFNSILKLLSGFRIFSQLVKNIHIFLLLIISALITYYYLVKSKNTDPFSRNIIFFNLLFFFSTLLHLQFAATNWFFRYEAYLLVFGMLIIAISSFSKKSPIWNNIAAFNKNISIYYIVILLLLIPYIIRAKVSLEKISQVSHERYLEHIIPAKFVSKYYNTKTVVINDIGSTAFFSDAKILDLFGLGSIEPILFRKSKEGYSSRNVFDWAEKKSAKIAIIQIQWKEISLLIPDRWIKVAEWHIEHNFIFGDRKIGIFAVNTQEKDTLISNLKLFSPQIPSDMVQYYLFH